jgi:hypothetical protein
MEHQESLKNGSLAHKCGFQSVPRGGTSTYRPLCVFLFPTFANTIILGQRHEQFFPGHIIMNSFRLEI